MAVVGVHEPPAGGDVHPGHQFGIQSGIGLALRRRPADPLVHAGDHVDPRLGRPGGAIGGDQGRLAGALHPRQGIGLEDRMVPDAGAHPGLGQLQDHRRDPAHGQGDGARVHPPGQAVRPEHPRIAQGRRVVRAAGVQAVKPGQTARALGGGGLCGVEGGHGPEPATGAAAMQGRPGVSRPPAARPSSAASSATAGTPRRRSRSPWPPPGTSPRRPRPDCRRTPPPRPGTAAGRR